MIRIKRLSTEAGRSLLLGYRILERNQWVLALLLCANPMGLSRPIFTPMISAPVNENMTSTSLLMENLDRFQSEWDRGTRPCREKTLTKRSDHGKDYLQHAEEISKSPTIRFKQWKPKTWALKAVCESVCVCKGGIKKDNWVLVRHP